MSFELTFQVSSKYNAKLVARVLRRLPVEIEAAARKLIADPVELIALDLPAEPERVLGPDHRSIIDYY